MTTDKNNSTAVIYIGPMIVKYDLVPNKCFKKGIPYDYPPYKQLFAEYNLFKYLFVAPKELIAKKRNLKLVGTVENQAVNQLKEGK